MALTATMPSPVTTILTDGPTDLTGRFALEHPELYQRCRQPHAAVGRDGRDSA
jgi:hypothetical protein